MSWFDDNIEKIKIGLDGESKVRSLFKDKKIPFMQVDIMFRYNNRWCLGEIKTQEMFTAPPFNGHGLPQWQIDRRMEFYKSTGVEPYLIVYDINNECLFLESLVKLTKTENFKTKGKSPRTIFKLSSFKKVKL